MYKDDFTFPVPLKPLMSPMTTLHFRKKKKEKPIGWKTTSPLMSSSTTTTWSCL